MTTELKDKIICILHNYLDNPCYSCIWWNNNMKCDLNYKKCNYSLRDERINDIASEIIGMIK